ncbi:MAG: hypothetical protein ACREHD_19665, partial [Pirellulales bacterium]
AWAYLSEYGKLALYFSLYGDSAVRVGLVIAALVIVTVGVRWWRLSKIRISSKPPGVSGV